MVLKVLHQELASDPEMRRAFVREAEISARLTIRHRQRHECSSRAIACDGDAALWTHGAVDIGSRLQGKVPLKLHLNVLCQVSTRSTTFTSLRCANGEPLECVMHRDISPHNVMVLHEGGIKVVDFGVPRSREQTDNHTRNGIIKGQDRYHATRAAGRLELNRRADLYSVGMMLWGSAAGGACGACFDGLARMRAIVKGELPEHPRGRAPVFLINSQRSSSVPSRMHPIGRFATADEMQIELDQVTLTEGGHSLPRALAESCARTSARTGAEAARDREGPEYPEFTLAGPVDNPPARTRSGVQVPCTRTATRAS